MFQKIISYYREYGLKKFFLRCFKPTLRLGRSIWTRKWYDVFMKHVERLPEPLDYADVKFLPVAESMIENLAKQLTDRYGIEAVDIISKQLESGDIAIVGFDRRNSLDMMFITWISKHDKLLKLFLGREPSNFESCSRRLYVPKKYRRRGIAERGLAYSDWLAGRYGMKALWTFIEKKNVASRKLYTTKLNYINQGTLCIGSFLGHKYSIVRMDKETC